jgi:TOBE domain
LRLDVTGPIGASVIIVELLGAETHVICQSENGTRIIVRQSPVAPRPSLGESVHIAVDGDASAYHLFDGASGLRLVPW